MGLKYEQEDLKDWWRCRDLAGPCPKRGTILIGEYSREIERGG